MLLSMVFQVLIPRGYMPGNVSEGGSPIVICGSDLQISFEELIGLEKGSLSETHDSPHLDELCVFSSILQTDSAILAQQQYVEFYLNQLSNKLPHKVDVFSKTNAYVLPIKTGPPAV